MLQCYSPMMMMIQGRSKCIGHTYYARRAIASGFTVDVHTKASAPLCGVACIEMEEKKIATNKTKSRKKEKKNSSSLRHSNIIRHKNPQNR